MSVRIGLIGAGRMGATFAYHLINSIPEADLIAIADAHGNTAGEVAARYGVESTYSDYCRLLERPDIDAVVIASPTNTHAEVIQAAARAGKHIFCEKPLALTMEDCDAAIAAVKAPGAHHGRLRRSHRRRKSRGRQASTGLYAPFRRRVSRR